MPQIHGLFLTQKLSGLFFFMHGGSHAWFCFLMPTSSWHSPGRAFWWTSTSYIGTMVKTLWILLGCFFNHGKDPFLSFSSTKGGTLHKIEEPCLGFMFLLSFSSQMNHRCQQILGVFYVGVRTFNGAVLWIWVLCLTTTSQRTLLPWTTIVLTNVGWFFSFFFWWEPLVPIFT